MKNNNLIWTISIVCILLLSGCGGTNEQTDSSNMEATNLSTQGATPESDSKSLNDDSTPESDSKSLNDDSTPESDSKSLNDDSTPESDSKSLNDDSTPESDSKS